MDPLAVDLVDAPAYSPAYDDALARALAAAGARVRLVTSRFAYDEAPVPDGYIAEEWFYRHSRGPAGSRRRAVMKRAEHAPDLLRYRRRGDLPDIVHLQWSNALDLRLAADRPTVLTVHDPHGHAVANLRRAGALVVHSAYARDRLLSAHSGLDPAAVHVIHHGALTLGSPGSLPPELAPTAAVVVLCFGLIRPYKGIDTLLAAWRQVHGAELWLVGRATYPIGALPPGVSLVDRYVTAAEQAALYDRADITVLPYHRSERSGFSGVLATALAAGAPTVVSDIGGFSDAVAAGAVLAVEPGDPDQLAAALQRLIDDPAQRLDLGLVAAEAARSRFSWQTAADATLALYRRLL